MMAFLYLKKGRLRFFRETSPFNHACWPVAVCDR